MMDEKAIKELVQSLGPVDWVQALILWRELVARAHQEVDDEATR